MVALVAANAKAVTGKERIPQFPKFTVLQIEGSDVAFTKQFDTVYAVDCDSDGKYTYSTFGPFLKLPGMPDVKARIITLEEVTPDQIIVESTEKPSLKKFPAKIQQKGRKAIQDRLKRKKPAVKRQRPAGRMVVK